VPPDLTSDPRRHAVSNASRPRRPALRLLTGGGVGLAIGVVYSLAAQAFGST
jgi:hypothetical protein